MPLLALLFDNFAIEAFNLSAAAISCYSIPISAAIPAPMAEA